MDVFQYFLFVFPPGIRNFNYYFITKSNFLRRFSGQKNSNRTIISQILNGEDDDKRNFPFGKKRKKKIYSDRERF